MASGGVYPRRGSGRRRRPWLTPSIGWRRDVRSVQGFFNSVKCQVGVQWLAIFDFCIRKPLEISGQISPKSIVGHPLKSDPGDIPVNRRYDPYWPLV
jgi:hypothetical protein